MHVKASSIMRRSIMIANNVLERKSAWTVTNEVTASGEPVELYKLVMAAVANYERTKHPEVFKGLAVTSRKDSTRFEMCCICDDHDRKAKRKNIQDRVCGFCIYSSLKHE